MHLMAFGRNLAIFIDYDFYLFVYKKSRKLQSAKIEK